MGLSGTRKTEADSGVVKILLGGGVKKESLDSVCLRFMGKRTGVLGWGSRSAVGVGL